MRISVVIPHLNQPESLARCLAALAANTRPPDEVLVVDNGSRIPPAEIAARHGARLLDEPAPGPGPARNRGAAAATGEVLAFLDADCRPDPGWLAEIARAFADPATEIAGGDVRIDLADPARPTALECYESIYAFRMDRYIREQGFTGTGNLAVRRSVWQAVGPFAGISVAEDRDWGRRATRAGRRIAWRPQMRVYHPARPDFATLAAKLARAADHDAAEAGRLRLLAKAAALPLSPLAELPRIAGSPRVRGPRMRALAFRVLLRVRLRRARLLAARALAPRRPAAAPRWNR